ncbi:MAG: methionyl-tRNA formyltransferase [Bdellovibrionota bacterium]
MLRVVFMGTPEFAVKALDGIAREHQVLGVYTQPDKPSGRGLGVTASAVKKRTLDLGLPVYQPEKLSLPGEFEKLAALKPDIIVVVAYGQILKKNVLELPRLGCINIHSSLLPRWRGAAPIQWAILGGDPESGVSTMRLVEKLDAGDVLMQAQTPISDADTAGSLHDRLAVMGAELISKTLSALEKSTLKGQVQDESQVTYASKLTKEMEFLDPALSAQDLDRRVRALNPWPGTSLFVKLGGETQRLRIKQAKVRADITVEPGKISERAGMLLLGTKQGALELLKFQWDGKKEIDPMSFVNGLKGRGEKLPLTVVSPPA